MLDDEGRFIALNDTREPQGKKWIAKNYLVPQTQKRSGSKSFEVANLLWDHYGYLLNQPKQDKPDTPPTAKDIDMADKQHKSFIKQVDELATQLPDNPDIRAVKRFLAQPEQVEKVKLASTYPECLKIKGCNLAFQRAGEDFLCCQTVALQELIANHANNDDANYATCLVSGANAPIARLHDGIAQIVGKPAPLASINAKAFESYGKTQGQNFPVSEQAAFEYATALNHLLRRDSKQKLYLGGTTLVCWGHKQHPLETDIPLLFGQQSDDPDRDTEKVIEHYRSPHTGAYQPADQQQAFYILGLAPNPPARIVVRFWLSGTVAEFSQRLGEWFSDLQIQGVEQFGTPSLYRLLASTTPLRQGKRKIDDLPPNLMGEVYLSILQGLPAPASLYSAVIRRIKAEQGKVEYLQACLIKASLNRKFRYLNQTNQTHHLHHRELTMSLDHADTRIGYCLGRLFATLEKLQLDAHGKLNSTIRDRYYSSASCTPKAVFGTLMRLSSHHMKKLEGKNPTWSNAADKRIGEIIDLIQEFPSHLDLDGQGLFAIGYYHQKQDFYTKRPTQEESTTEQGDSE